MPNSYDALLDASEQTATQPNEYDALLDGDAQRSQLRASLTVASDNDPDKYAEAKRLSRATGIPAPVINHDVPTVARRVKLNEYDQLLDTSPALVKHLQNPDFASMAQDDTGVLSKVENATRAFTSGAIPSTASGLYSLAAAPFDVLSQVVTGPLTGKLLPEDIGAKIGDTLRGLAAQQNQLANQAVSVPGAGTVEQSVYSGLQSLGQNIGPLALSVITGQPELALGVMSGLTGGQSYLRGRQAGLSPLKALGYGASDAAVEFGTEKIPVGKLIGDLKAGSGLLKTFLHNQVAEQLGEQAATVLQDFNQWAEINPDKPFSDYLAQRPNAALQTAIATAVASGGQVAIAKVVDTAARTMQTKALKAAVAAEKAKKLGELGQQAAASKLRTRDPQSFQQFVDTAAANSPVQDIYVDANTFAQTLQQSGVDAETLAPSVRDQMNDALVTGGDLQIPIGEYATHIAPSAAGPALLPHLRTSPDAMSAAEAQEFYQNGNTGDELRNEIERAATDQLPDEAARIDTAAVENDILGQLTQANRFTSDVNRNYAVLLGNFYATMAHRSGLTAQELYQRYPLRIQAQATSGAQTLDQPGNERGQISFGPDITQAPSVISLLRNADLSTFLHESGHFFLEALADMASRDDAPQPVKDDMATVAKWLGVPDASAWRNLTADQKRAHHEQFARGFEAYAFEGNAPSSELAGVFQRFRAWLLNVYQSLRSLNVDLNDEVRGVFNRMLATDEQIRATEAARSYRPLFTSAEAAGMTQQEWENYQREAVEGPVEARDTLARRGLRDMQWLANAKSRKLRELQRDAAGKRKSVRREVEAEIMAQPVYQAMRFLQRGELPDGTKAIPESEHRLSLPTLKEIYGDGPAALWRYLTTGKYGLAATEGADPEIIAQMFGFSSGDELVRALVDVGSIPDAIEALTDRRMLERYGDLSSPDALDRAANAAIHNDVRGRFLATELKALEQATGRPRLITRAARLFAQATIARKLIRSLTPAQYTRAEARAGRDAEQAFRAGDVVTAAADKRKQLLNHELVRATLTARDEVERGTAYLKKFASPGVRKNLRGEFLEQLDALLARFDLRTSQTLKQIDARKSLGEWVKEEADRWSAVAPDIAPEFLNENYRKHFRDLTVEEFRGLVDTVKQLEKLARREQQAYITLRNMTFAEEKARILDELRAHNPKAFNADGEPEGVRPDYVPSIKKKLKHVGDSLQAEFLNVETLINIMAGGEVGQMHESLFERLSHRADWKAGKLQEIYALLKPMLAQYSVKERLEFSQRGHYIPEIDDSLTRENMLVVALLYGNPEGRMRLLQGQGWNDDQVKAIIDHLVEKDWRFADTVWRLFDENLWPELKALNDRTRGSSPPKVEALPYPTKFGTARGGYFRIKYDGELSERAHQLDETTAIKEMLGGGMGMPRTNQGTSTARLQEVNRPVRLDLGVMAETVNETVHDLAYREPVADIWRLLNSRRIQNAIKVAGGTEVYRALVQRLRETAAPPRNPTGFVERTLSRARKNTLVVAMGLSFKTALVNVTGIVPVMARVNTGALIKALGKFYSPAMTKYYQFVIERSDYMRYRHEAYERDLQDSVKKFSAAGSLLPEYAGWFAMITYVDRGTSFPTWLAAYDEAMRRNANDEARAIEYADHIVRQTHGSGRIVDLAQIQSGHGGWGQLKKAFTMFYSYFSSQLGMLVRSGKINARAAKAGNPFAVARLAADFMFIVMMPAVLNEIASGRCDKAEDAAGWGKCVARGVALYASGFVPIWRDVAAFTWSLFDKDIHNYGFRITPAESYFEGLAKASKSAVDVAGGEGDQTDARNIILGASYLFGLPGYQIWRTLSGIDAASRGEAGPQAIVLGPPRK